MVPWYGIPKESVILVCSVLHCLISSDSAAFPATHWHIFPVILYIVKQPLFSFRGWGMSLPHVIPQQGFYQGTSQPQEKFSWHLSKGSALWKASFKVFIPVIIRVQEPKERAGKAPWDTYCRRDEQMLQKRHWTSYGAALPEPRSFSRNRQLQVCPLLRGIKRASWSTFSIEETLKGS